MTCKQLVYIEEVKIKIIKKTRHIAIKSTLYDLTVTARNKEKTYKNMLLCLIKHTKQIYNRKYTCLTNIEILFKISYQLVTNIWH